jgi:hypothetical protein
LSGLSHNMKIKLVIVVLNVNNNARKDGIWDN